MLELTFVAVPVVVAPVVVKPVEGAPAKSPVETPPIPADLTPQARPILAYQTPPSAKGLGKSRWRLSGKTIKRVTCGKCGCAFRYELIRSVSAVSLISVLSNGVIVVLLMVTCLATVGISMLFAIRMVARLFHSAFNGGAGDEHSNRKLRRVLERAVDPVPCPQCGWYQPDMVSEARSRSFNWTRWLQLAVLILAPMFWYAAWNFGLFSAVRLFDWDWTDARVVALLVAAFAAALIGVIECFRWGLSFSVDPNTGYPAEREPYPHSPVATTEAEWAKQMAAQTSRVTAARQPRAAVGSGPRRIVPPGTG
jgi:hypothetical protein